MPKVTYVLMTKKECSLISQYFKQVQKYRVKFSFFFYNVFIFLPRDNCY